MCAKNIAFASKWQKILIFFVILFSIILKLKGIPFLDNSDNIISTLDAFRHARYVEETLSNSYKSIDYLADYPDYVSNQSPPPLLSYFTAWLSRVLFIDIKVFYLILPPLLSVLFVIPLYKWLQPLNNDYITLGCITLSLFNFQYFARTSPGYFDTDCLMLFFIFCIILFITRAIAEKDNIKSYFNIFIAGTVLVIFRWWYDHLFFAIIFIFSIILGQIIWRHRARGVLLKLSVFILILNPIELIYYVITSPFLKDYVYGNIVNIQEFKIPVNVYADIAELQPSSVKEFINHTTDNPVTFIFGIFGFALLFYRNVKYLLPIMPLVIIGFSAFFSGYRYLIYASPFIGMGLGYFVYLFKDFVIKKYNFNNRVIEIIAVVALIFLSFPAQRLYFNSNPYFNEKKVTDFKKINELTEKDAVIISWWDIGNPIQYYAKRATFLDNANFNPYKVYLILKILTEPDEKLAYKYISFLTNNKCKDYQHHLTNLTQFISIASGYDENARTPIYIVLYNQILTQNVLKDNSLSKVEEDLIRKRIPQYYFMCTITKNALGDCEDIVLDLKQKTLQIIDKNVHKGYSKVVLFDKTNNKNQTFPLNPKAKQIIFLILSKEGKLYQINAHEDFEKSLLFKMLIESKKDFTHFDLVYEDFPYMVLYKVK